MTYEELNTVLEAANQTLTPARSYFYSPEDQVNTLFDIAFPTTIALPWSTEIKKTTTDLTPFTYDEYEISLAFLDQFAGTNHAHDSNNDDKLATVAAQWEQAKRFIYALYEEETLGGVDVSINRIESYKIEPLHIYISNHVAVGVALTFKYRVKTTIDYC